MFCQLKNKLSHWWVIQTDIWAEATFALSIFQFISISKKGFGLRDNNHSPPINLCLSKHICKGAIYIHQILVTKPGIHTYKDTKTKDQKLSVMCNKMECTRNKIT